MAINFNAKNGFLLFFFLQKELTYDRDNFYL